MSAPKIAFTLPFLLALWACKPHNSSYEVQSLENFASSEGANIIENDCSGSFGPIANLKEEIEGPEELVAVARRALSSVPHSFREAFTNSMKGRILISNNIDEACKNATKNISEHLRLKSATNIDLRSCFIPATSGYGFDIVLPAQDKAIKHSLVRAYFSAIIFVMASANYDHKSDLALPIAQQSDEVKNLSKQVSLALLFDFKRGIAAGEITKERALQIFGESLLNSSNPEVDWNSNPRFTQDMKDVISYQATLETADQYYCSARTKAVMAQRFTNSMQAFERVFVQPMNALESNKAGTQSQGLSLAENTESSLALYWQPFGGFFARRIAARNAGYGGFAPYAAQQADYYTQSGARTLIGQRLAARQILAQNGYHGYANWSVAPVARLASLGGQSYYCQDCNYG